MSRRVLAALLTATMLGFGAPMPAQAQHNAITAEEARIGAEQHEQVAAQFGGPYNDPKLQAYITQIGERLKNVTPMRDEKFTFTLLDSDIINAFALPGGYVYVTRGLLALARDEAELAGVLGHEIGHVVAHHTAERSQRSTWAQLGAVGAQLLGGLLGGYLGGDVGARLGAQLGGQGGSLAGTYYVQSYSREQELEADQLGIKFLEAAGYEPRAMASFLAQLQANEKLEADLTGQRATVPAWLQDHPRTADRVTAASEAAARATPGAREQDRERFLKAIDGLIYGDDPAQGFVQGRTFVHPELGFRFTAPPGFTLKNTPAAVLGKDEAGRFLKFDMGQSRTSDPQAYIAREWAPKAQISNLDSLRVGNLNAAAGVTQVKVNGQPAEAMLVAIDGGGGTMYRFVFADPQGIGRQDLRDFEASAQSFQKLAKGEAADIKPLRIRIHTVRSGDTQESLAKLMDVDKLPLETFRVINGLEPNAPLRPGDELKLIQRG